MPAPSSRAMKTPRQPHGESSTAVSDLLPVTNAPVVPNVVSPVPDRNVDKEEPTASYRDFLSACWFGG
jgi:hypothetical protein